MRRCFQCGAVTAIEGLTRVGDGDFCASCFRALLGASPLESASAASPSAVRRPAMDSGAPEPPARPSRAPAPRRTCLVCDRDLGGVPAVVFLGGEICGPCSAEMAAELAAANETPARATDAGPGAAAPETAAEPLLARAGAEAVPMFTPGSGTARCAGCERPMPGPGSYRLLHGKPYCPACLPFYARLAPAPRDATASAATAPVRPAGAEGTGGPDAHRASADSAGLVEAPPSCDCCRRPLDATAQARDGFTLCSACLSSDAELALSVARARHRRELARLRSTLEGSS